MANPVMFVDQAVTALTGAWQNFVFVFAAKPFRATTMLIINDESPSGNYIDISYDGTNIAFRLLPGENKLINGPMNNIYLMGQAGGESYRMTAD